MSTVFFGSNLGFNIGFTFERAPYARFYRFPSAKFHEIWIQHVDRCRDEHFWKHFPAMGHFSKKTTRNRKLFQRLATSDRHNSAMIIDRRKFITKRSLYGMSIFHFYRWNQFKVIPLACTLRTRSPPIFCDIGRELTGSTVDSRDMSVMTEDRDVDICKPFNLKKRALRAEYCIVGIPHNTGI